MREATIFVFSSLEILSTCGVARGAPSRRVAGPRSHGKKAIGSRRKPADGRRNPSPRTRGSARACCQVPEERWRVASGKWQVASGKWGKSRSLTPVRQNQATGFAMTPKAESKNRADPSRHGAGAMTYGEGTPSNGPPQKLRRGRRGACSGGHTGHV